MPKLSLWSYIKKQRQSRKQVKTWIHVVYTKRVKTRVSDMVLVLPLIRWDSGMKCLIQSVSNAKKNPTTFDAGYIELSLASPDVIKRMLLTIYLHIFNMPARNLGICIQRCQVLVLFFFFWLNTTVMTPQCERFL